MKDKKLLRIILYIGLIIATLLAYNSDLFSYYDSYTVNHNFDPKVDSKGNYLLTPVISLKKGVYEINFEGNSNGRGNGFYILSGNQIILQDEFLSGEIKETISFDVEQPSQQIQIGAVYNPESNGFSINRVAIFSKHVLYFNSLIRHLFVSFFILLIYFLIGWRFLFKQSWGKRFKKLATPVNERIFLYLFFLSVLTTTHLYFKDAYLRPDDFFFQLSRVEGIVESLKNGIFPARINPFFLNGYGYADGLYYPNVFLYFPAILRMLGFNALTTYKIFSFTANFLAILICYLSAANIGKSRYAGLIAATLYGFASFRLTDFMYRCTLGEALSFLFIPLIIWGLYEIFSSHAERWGLFALGFLGVTWSHLLSLSIVTIFTFIYLLINIKTILTDRRVLSALLKSVILVVGLSAFFFLPMIEQTVSNNLKSNILLSSIHSISDPGKKFVAGSFPLIPTPVWDSYSDPNLGYPLLFLPLIFLFSNKKNKNSTYKIATKLIIAGFITTFISTEYFPWQWFAWLANRLQFSWRILILAIPLISIGGGLLINEVVDKKRKMPVLITIFCFSSVCFMPFFNNALENRLVTENYPVHVDSYRVSGGEYMPIGAEVLFIDRNKDTVLSDADNLEILFHDRKPLQFSFEYRISEADDSIPVHFEAPVLYYTGYQAVLNVEGKEPTPLKTYLGTHGFVAFDITGEPEGKVTVYYQKTRWQYIGDYLTLATLIFIIVALLHQRRKNKKMKAEN